MTDLMGYATCTDHLDGTGVIAELETAIKQLTGFLFVLSMSSASSALHAAYDALDLKHGDEVILPALTAAETAAPLIHKGCTLILCDVDDTLTLDPTHVERLITPRTTAIVAVDLLGQPHDTAAMRDIADEHSLRYVSDSAQAFGARRDGRVTGSAADAVIFSLNGQKDLAAGEGGLLLTNKQALYEHALRATQHPRRQARELGAARANQFCMRNGRLNPLAAAVAVAHFLSVLDQIAQRRTQAQAAIELLNASGLTERITLPPASEPTFSYLTATWRNLPQPAALLATLHQAGLPMRLRNLPVRPLHTLPMPEAHYRIPTPLPQTAAALQRCCLERMHL
jgi:dTDP-4-amino-4,6-dideoxygalactose transaminase